jgi:hypothetical protein
MWKLEPVDSYVVGVVPKGRQAVGGCLCRQWYSLQERFVTFRPVLRAAEFDWPPILIALAADKALIVSSGFLQALLNMLATDGGYTIAAATAAAKACVVATQSAGWEKATLVSNWYASLLLKLLRSVAVGVVAVLQLLSSMKSQFQSSKLRFKPYQLPIQAMSPCKNSVLRVDMSLSFPRCVRWCQKVCLYFVWLGFGCCW